MQLFTTPQENDPDKFPWQKPKPGDNRRGKDRRQTEGEGFAYIPMVGWYCRRDHTRRVEDIEEEKDKKESE